MTDEAKKYTVNGPKGWPFFGLLRESLKDPLKLAVRLSQEYGDIIPLTVLGQRVIQVNHPDLVKHVLVENHKNYRKSNPYIRFESVLGKGLFTSEGEKWRRDRQKIQPMFKREQIEGYYFDVISQIADKYHRRWTQLTASGAARINITAEMADITLEVVTKLVFGSQLSDAAIADIHRAYDEFMEYLRLPRLFPKLDLRKLARFPSYRRFEQHLNVLKSLFADLLQQYKQGEQTETLNMLALLVEAQKNDPEHFSDAELLDQCFTMIFAGFETTSILMQWMWKVQDERPDVREVLRQEIALQTSAGLNYQAVSGMDRLSAFFHETSRLYPPIWLIGKQPIADDWYGDYHVKKDTLVVIPQFTMQRHPRYWENPNAFILERFLPLSDVVYDTGLFFPFSHGPRKCSGFKLAEMEAKVIFAKLLPFFDVSMLNSALNGFDPGISLKPGTPLIAEIRPVTVSQ